MTIDTRTLAAIASTYVKAMTSIRGRRVHRLVMRELARFDLVLPARAEDGSIALLALADDGAVAVCHTDGTGPAAPVAAFAIGGVTVTTTYDLLKDSLPVVGWTLWHPGLANGTGLLSVQAVDVSQEDRARVASVLSR